MVLLKVFVGFWGDCHIQCLDNNWAQWTFSCILLSLQIFWEAMEKLVLEVVTAHCCATDATDLLLEPPVLLRLFLNNGWSVSCHVTFTNPWCTFLIHTPWVQLCLVSLLLAELKFCYWSDLPYDLHNDCPFRVVVELKSYEGSVFHLGINSCPCKVN